MNDFFLELWHDLREKRLVPVAAGLLLAVVAIPAVMLKSSSPSEGVAAVTPPPKTQGVNTLLPVQLLGSEDKGASKLGSFDPKNPFKPGIRLDRDGAVSAGGAAGAAGAAVALAGELAGAVAAEAGGKGGGGGGGGVPTGSPSIGVPSPAAPTTRTARYTYVLDVTFVKNGRARKLRGVRRLSMLPNQDAPLLLYLGVDGGADNALFLVDSTLKTFGEGSCKPSKSECGVLTLGSGAEHEFTDAEDNSYGIRIDQIRRLSAKRAARSARARSSSARASSGSKRRFVPPFLTDVESETTTGAGR